MSESIVIQFTRQRRGLNFVLHPSSRRRLVEEPERGGPPAQNVFVGRGAKERAEDFPLEAVREQVVGLLTGASMGELLAHHGTVEFQEMPSGEVAHVVREEPG